jgi:hypothetical protein
MLNLRNRLKAWKLSRELFQSEKKLIKLSKKISTVDSQLDKLAISDYHKQQKKLVEVRSRYVSFLKDNNLWTKQMEEKYNKKLLKHPLRMSKFDLDFVKRLARQKMNKKLNDPIMKLFKKKVGHKYGDSEYEDYLFHMYVLDFTEEVCRVNNWLTRLDWKEHGVPMNSIIKSFYEVSVKYADIKKYYAKQFYDQRTALHTK